MPSSARPAFRTPRSGFSLMELALVVVILALLATLAVPRLGGVLRDAKQNAAEADMEAIRTALLGDGASTHGLVGDLEGIAGFSPAYLRLANLIVPTNLVGVADHWLDDDGRRLADAGFAVTPGAVNLTTFAEFSVFTNRDEIAERGWNGPYLTHCRLGEFPDSTSAVTEAERSFFPRGTGDNQRAYGIPGEPAILDPWDNPYILQVPPAEAWSNPNDIPEPERFRYARIVSAGPDRVLSTPCFGTATAADRRDCRLAGRRETSRKTGETRGDDIVLFLLRADTYEDEDK